MTDNALPENAPSTVLIGRLLDDSTSQPLVGLTVVASERDDGDGRVLRRAHTDAQGCFTLRLSDDDLRTFMAGASAQPSFHVDVTMSVWNGEEWIAKLAPRLATGPVPERVVLGDFLITVPSAVRTYALRASVVSAEARPVAGVEVVLMSVELGQRQALTSGTTNDDGEVELSYTGGPNASERDTDRRLQLVASYDDNEIARSPVLFDVHDDQRIRMVVPEDLGEGLTELERLQAAIAGHVGQIGLENLTLEDVELVAQRADVYPPHLALLVRATTLASGTSVTVDELYAMGRHGMPLTIAGLLARDAEAYRSALGRAFARRLIPVPAGGEAAALDSIASRMADWAGAATVNPTLAAPRWTNLERSGVSAATRQAFATAWVGLTGTLTERWTAIRSDPALEAAVPALQFTAGASMLLGEHGPAVQALVDARTAGQVSTLRDLAACDHALRRSNARG